MDFWGKQNLNRNEIINYVVHRGTVFPSSAAAGQLFFKTSTNDLYIYKGTGWVKIAIGTPAPPVFGLIGMWHQSLGSIPSDWALCDGSSGTPNLMGKLLKGIAPGNQPGTTGGSNTHTHTLGDHVHDFSAGSTTVQNAGAEPSGGMTCGGGTHGHPYSGGTSGPSISGSDAASSLPPYCELAYIMKK